MSDAHCAEKLREVIARHGLSASKALGQNFILDRQLLARIAALPGPLTDATVYEVGPGPGGLTGALLEAGAKVIAVERDRRCLPASRMTGVLHGKRIQPPEAIVVHVFGEPMPAGNHRHGADPRRSGTYAAFMPPPGSRTSW